MLHISISKADTIRYRHHYNSLWMIFSQLFSYFHQNMLKCFSILKVIETAADKNLSSNLKTIKFRVSQQHIGPLILEKSQMYILTRVNLLNTVCYEIPCIWGHTVFMTYGLLNFSFKFYNLIGLKAVDIFRVIISRTDHCSGFT